MNGVTEEHLRLDQDARRQRNWKRWGPYLSERQWGTVREDYSANGDSWNYFPHDHARSRAYRWGEDGLMGICDRECRICFAVALWNENDPILKERLFGLTGPEGNHGEDVKESYFYLDSTPTHSWMSGLYKYPQAEFPYAQLVEKNAEKGLGDLEYELVDSGVFDANRYFDILVEYAKASPNDILIRITATNRGDRPAPLHLLPTAWFRNTWTWGCDPRECWIKPSGHYDSSADHAVLNHATLPSFYLSADTDSRGQSGQWLFTDNESNNERLYGTANAGKFLKDGFHRYVVNGEAEAVNSKMCGTKMAVHYRTNLAPGESHTIQLRLCGDGEIPPHLFGDAFEDTFRRRRSEADEFYQWRSRGIESDERRAVQRQADAGLLWTKQFYHYIVEHWLEGDSEQLTVPESRKSGRNSGWRHIFNRDILSMPDKWEYPWFAAWDSAFHMIPFATLDPEFAMDQLVLFLREWYMHPNGQIPAYEWALDDVNPPVHAWSCWEVYQRLEQAGEGSRVFLARVFQKLLLNFTWWINRKDMSGNNLFAGGFLGLDNIGVFDRSKPLPTGGHIEQADGTAWMAFYCSNMLSIAMELAKRNPAYGDMASKFFEHFVTIAEAMNSQGGSGLWDESDGFYYDHLAIDGHSIPLRVRSLVGLIPLLTTTVLEDDVIDQLPGFSKRTQWYIDRHAKLGESMTYLESGNGQPGMQGRRLLAVPSQPRLIQLLRYMLDENEFLSPYGIRSLSRVHLEKPYSFTADGEEHLVGYVPGESDTWMFGGNSNWRGPIWFPLNFLIIQSLTRLHSFYGDSFQVECPTGSGQMASLGAVADELRSRLVRLFLADEEGRRPCHGNDDRFRSDPHWKELVLFYEYFHGDNGRGCGASHQTGWTALVAELMTDCQTPAGNAKK